MLRGNVLVKILGPVAILMLLAGCSLTYTIKEPVLSSIDYGRQDVPSVTLTIIDKRTGLDSEFVIGKLGPAGSLSKIPVALENMGDPIGYFAQQLGKELSNRKIPVQCVVGKTAAGGLILEINRYQIINRRATGFSPWEACHIFYGTIIKEGQKTPIKAFFYNGKTPAWSMNEIVEPCFNIPISILIKDVASKINRAVFNYSLSDEKIDRLTAEIDPDIGKDENGPFWKVLELGDTNNPKAMEPLQKYAQMKYEFFRSCAISAIGTLGASGQLEFLKQQYRQDGYNNRYMAIKAIGDLGTPEALQFIQSLKTDPSYEKESGIKYSVDLYAP